MSHLNNTEPNDNDQITQQEAWGILDSFFNEKGLVRQQIESYDEFLCDNIPKIIETSQPIEVDITGPLITTKYYYKFTNTYIGFPKVLEADGSLTDLTPNTARLRNLCYEVPIYITINYKKIEIDNKSGEQKIIEEKDDTTKFCNVPLMLNSKHCFLHGKSDKERILLGECEYDQGGYFIVNGSEKVLIAQERLATNQVYVFLNKSNSYFAEIRSIQEGEFKSANQLLVKYLLPPKKNTIVNEKILRVTIPYIKKDIPLFIVFMALGITNKDDIMKRIISENDESYEGRDPKTDEYLKILNYSYEESFIITNQEDALDYIGKRTTLLCDTREKRITCVLKIFQKEFLPHLSVDDDSFGIKSYFFGYIVKKLLDTVLEKRQVDDRDNFGNKRLDLSSTLLGNMFRISFTKVIREFKIIVEKHIQTSKSIFIKNDLNGKDITKDLRYAMSTGNWGSSKQKITKTGVAQALNRLSYSATLSHLRRVVAPIAKDGKSMKPRQLHNTSILQMCPSETPEGHGCGIVKNMTLLTHLSLNSSSDLVDEFLDNPENNMRLIRLKEISDKNISVNGIKVFLNGKWIGVHNNSSELLKYLINLRRSGKINYDVSIKILNEELCIDTDGGRCCVPLIVVKDNKLTITKDDIYKLKEGSKIWSDLVREGKIEYLDVNEMATSLIASTYNDLQEYSQIGYNYTHCEIHPSMILGVCASMIPFPDHNQAPRNTYQSAMSKQAMGIYATNYNMRMDTMAHVLFYPQKPMMQTKSSKYLNYGEMPAGHNCIVAIACYSGFNQEDSLIINKSAVDRGMFRSIFYRSYKDEENKKMNGLVEEFGLPDPNTVMGTKNNNYNNIDEDGLPKVGASYNSHEILVGKTVPIQTPVNSQNPSKMLMSKYTHKDVSMPIRTAESGIVDQVMISTNLDGKKFTKIRMRSIRVPEIGDKAACYCSNTEILTNKGWIFIKDLSFEYKVATLFNNNMKYTTPLEIMSYDYNDKMYKIKSNQIDLLVTPNHRMYVGNRNGNSFTFKYAEDIYGKRITYKKNIEKYISIVPENNLELLYNENNEIVSFILGNITVNINDWLILFGIWIAEGHSSKDYVNISTHKERVRNALNNIENENIKFGKYKESKNDTILNVYRIYNKNFVNYFSKLSVGSVNKFLPDWVWYLSSEQCKILIQGMMLGDGHTMKNGTRRYDTSSIKLANNFQQLCLHAGYSANISVKYKKGKSSIIKKEGRNGEIITQTTDAYRLTIIEKQNTPLVNKNIKKDGSNRHDSWENYDGKVYCCRVEGPGLIYVRRNGIPVWSGNSRHG
jgi:DNA-directed RNA polymerase II subunit RPB2